MSCDVAPVAMFVSVSLQKQEKPNGIGGWTIYVTSIGSKKKTAKVDEIFQQYGFDGKTVL